MYYLIKICTIIIIEYILYASKHQATSSHYNSEAFDSKTITYVRRTAYLPFSTHHQNPQENFSMLETLNGEEANSEKKQCIIVSGAAGFIGSSICHHLTANGYNVLKLDIRDVENTCDITDPSAVERWFQHAKAVQPNVFALVNCVGIPDVAGGQSATDITEISSETFRLHLKVNLEAVFTMVREFVRFYRSQAEHIINFSSLYAVSTPSLEIYDGKIKHPGYVASKAGIVGLSKYCAVLCAKDNIRVNCIAPAAVAETKGVEAKFLSKYNSKVPLNRPISLQECADAVAYLLLSKNTTGQNLVIDGGFSL